MRSSSPSRDPSSGDHRVGDAGAVADSGADRAGSIAVAAHRRDRTRRLPQQRADLPRRHLSTQAAHGSATALQRGPRLRPSHRRRDRRPHSGSDTHRRGTRDGGAHPDHGAAEDLPSRPVRVRWTRVRPHLPPAVVTALDGHEHEVIDALARTTSDQQRRQAVRLAIRSTRWDQPTAGRTFARALATTLRPSTQGASPNPSYHRYSGREFGR